MTNEEIIDLIDFAIKATNSQDDYSIGMRNGMRYAKSLIDGKEAQYEIRRTEEEINLGIDLGDEVVGDYGGKGVVVGINTYQGENMFELIKPYILVIKTDDIYHMRTVVSGKIVVSDRGGKE